MAPILGAQGEGGIIPPPPGSSSLFFEQVAPDLAHMLAVTPVLETCAGAIKVSGPSEGAL